MKVSHALRVVNISVSAVFKYILEIESSHIDNLTTAWFIEMLSKWFDLMSSCSRVMALSKQIPDRYAEFVKLLKVVN
jgi:hypothetical protein